MKNFLFYYYHLYPEKLIQKNRNYFFTIDHISYMLLLLTRTDEETKELILLNQVLIKHGPFPKVEQNKFQQYVTMINEKPYLLIRYTFQNRKITYHDILRNPIHVPSAFHFPFLNRSDWAILWSRKIDYFEYQKPHIKKKYPYLYESMDYYIGYAEVAISYIQEVNRSIKKERADIVTVAHRRIPSSFTLVDFYNPLSLVIDYRVRDTAEYLKSIFLEGYSAEILKEIILQSIDSTYSAHLLMARILFPSFYFDLYEEIINNVTKEDKIFPVLEKSRDYEDFLLLVYQIIKEKSPLIKIDFLER